MWEGGDEVGVARGEGGAGEETVRIGGRGGDGLGDIAGGERPGRNDGWEGKGGKSSLLSRDNKGGFKGMAGVIVEGMLMGSEMDGFEVRRARK